MTTKMDELRARFDEQIATMERTQAKLLEEYQSRVVWMQEDFADKLRREEEKLRTSQYDIQLSIEKAQAMKRSLCGE